MLVHSLTARFSLRALMRTRVTTTILAFRSRPFSTTSCPNTRFPTRASPCGRRCTWLRDVLTTWAQMLFLRVHRQVTMRPQMKKRRRWRRSRTAQAHRPRLFFRRPAGCPRQPRPKRTENQQHDSRHRRPMTPLIRSEYDRVHLHDRGSRATSRRRSEQVYRGSGYA